MNGLSKQSQLMVDKLFTVPIEGIGSSMACLGDNRDGRA
jgi:hypothetical protein